jgi:hypothetical protein
VEIDNKRGRELGRLYGRGNLIGSLAKQLVWIGVEVWGLLKWRAHVV